MHTGKRSPANRLIGATLLTVFGLLSVTWPTLKAAPVSDLRDGRAGRIEYESVTPPNRWEFVRKVRENTTSVTVTGELLMPQRFEGKVPAVVISHASGGVTSKLYELWGKALNDAGIAVFIPNSFQSRGIGTTTDNQAQLDVSADVADALFALKLLATHPRIDPQRIFHMGGSRGGTAAFETYWDTVRRAVISDELKFAGHIPLYQGNCNTRFRFDRGDTNRAPMMALLAGADDGTPAAACEAYYSELNQGGANIRWRVVKDAHHGFDSTDTRRTYLPQGVTAKNCTIEVFISNVRGSGLGEARDYKSGAAIKGFSEWNQAFKACNSRGYTVAGDNRGRELVVEEVVMFVQQGR